MQIGSDVIIINVEEGKNLVKALRHRSTSKFISWMEKNGCLEILLKLEKVLEKKKDCTYNPCRKQ